MTSQIMYDSTTPALIPTTAKLILTYIDGNYVTDAWVAANRPLAQRITTTTTKQGNLSARIYDCERGDGNASQAAAWASQKLRINERPTIYCSRVGEENYGWSWVKDALMALKIPLASVDFGIADYTGVSHLVPGSAFTQYANPATSGGNYDLSITNGIWPNTLDPPKPSPTGGTIIVENQNIIYAESATDGNRHVFVYNPDSKQTTHWYQNMKGVPNYTWIREVLPGVAA